MSQKLVTIENNAPIEVKLQDIAFSGYQSQEVSQFFKELGFQSLLSRIQPSEKAGVEDLRQENLPDLHVEVVEELTEDMFLGREALVVEMLYDNYHQSPVEGIAIVNENDAFVLTMEQAKKSQVFKDWAENSQTEKWVFDAKRTLVALMRHGIHAQGIHFDLLLASYLINPSENNHDIPAVSHRMGEVDVKFDEEVYGKGAKLKRPDQDEVFYEHISRKASMLFKLKEPMEKQLKQNEQFSLYNELEMPLALILGRMEHYGVQVDVERLKTMRTELQSRLETIEKEIFELSGEPFNLNSPKQLGPILFEKLELPVVKKTKTGYSTSADVLEQLEDQHEIIAKILMYRQLGKLQSTYIEGLLKVSDVETNKIHTRFNQALTQTGRLSSTDPNLQNIPIRLEEGRRIRQAFVPSQSDWVMFASDYSQIELRVLAHIAKDEKLMAAFKEGHDIHTQTASEVFSVPGDEVTSQMRRHAKAVNFGIVYGISEYGLSQSLGITRKEAKAFIEQYFASYPGVKEYMDETVQEAKRVGYVSTFMNRRRYLQDITSRNFNKRSFAERTAMNTPIQGSAADIIKKAMIDLDQRLSEENMQAKMLMQVHDELILEAPRNEIEKLKEVVASVMEQTVELSVPLEVDYSYGPTWYDAK